MGIRGGIPSAWRLVPAEGQLISVGAMFSLVIASILLQLDPWIGTTGHRSKVSSHPPGRPATFEARLRQRRGIGIQTEPGPHSAQPTLTHTPTTPPHTLPRHA